ncbi:hypothetical protein PHMEG_00015926 [Phytophthora megakarya]|uniref:MULE transposase domain-containing protein n=1 Tax=Phytophthora megakarya TaxID=4795 RepID=A0A225W0J0_9STRA|nr:hypothetical protein PHMEG_00015926 [Phytophthora megakarya]
MLRTIARLASIAIIKYACTQATGSDAFRAIESTLTRNVAETDPRPFLQFSIVHTIGCGLHRCIGFGHPELIRLLRYSNSAIYIDGTFKTVPATFQQCLIMMVKGLGVDVYVPAIYVLMDSKHQDAYCNALNFVIIQTGRLLEPATVTCDFEKGLMNAVTEQFSLVKIMGCLFHWKQPLRRKMIELRIPQDQIAAALSPGMMDVLTIIPVTELLTRELNLCATESQKLENYGADLWDVNSMIEAGIDLHNRTSNPLESFNRVFRGKFNPGTRRLVRLIDDVKNHHREPPPHAACVEPVIPPDYDEFEDVLTGVGVMTHRSPKDIQTKIASLQQSFKTASDWLDATGQTMRDKKRLRDGILMRCPNNRQRHKKPDTLISILIRIGN